MNPEHKTYRRRDASERWRQAPSPPEVKTGGTVLTLLRIGTRRCRLTAAIMVVLFGAVGQTAGQAYAQARQTALYLDAPTVSTERAVRAGEVAGAYAEPSSGASPEVLAWLDVPVRSTGVSTPSSASGVDAKADAEAAFVSITAPDQEQSGGVTAEAALRAGEVMLAQIGEEAPPTAPEATPGEKEVSDLALSGPVRPELGDGTPAQAFDSEDSREEVAEPGVQPNGESGAGVPEEVPDEAEYVSTSAPGSDAQAATPSGGAGLVIPAPVDDGYDPEEAAPVELAAAPSGDSALELAPDTTEEPYGPTGPISTTAQTPEEEPATDDSLEESGGAGEGGESVPQAEPSAEEEQVASVEPTVSEPVEDVPPDTEPGGAGLRKEDPVPAPAPSAPSAEPPEAATGPISDGEEEIALVAVAARDWGSSREGSGEPPVARAGKQEKSEDISLAEPPAEDPPVASPPVASLPEEEHGVEQIIVVDSSVEGLGTGRPVSEAQAGQAPPVASTPQEEQSARTDDCEAGQAHHPEDGNCEEQPNPGLQPETVPLPEQEASPEQEAPPEQESQPEASALPENDGDPAGGQTPTDEAAPPSTDGGGPKQEESGSTPEDIPEASPPRAGDDPQNTGTTPSGSDAPATTPPSEGPDAQPDGPLPDAPRPGGDPGPPSPVTLETGKPETVGTTRGARVGPLERIERIKKRDGGGEAKRKRARDAAVGDDGMAEDRREVDALRGGSARKPSTSDPSTHPETPPRTTPRPTTGDRAGRPSPSQGAASGALEEPGLLTRRPSAEPAGRREARNLGRPGPVSREKDRPKHVPSEAVTALPEESSPNNTAGSAPGHPIEPDDGGSPNADTPTRSQSAVARPWRREPAEGFAAGARTEAGPRQATESGVQGTRQGTPRAARRTQPAESINRIDQVAGE